ncbi:MAG: TIM barrel protein, partial [Chloroflexia bacterium]
KEAGADFVELAPHRLGAIVGGELESRRTRTLARIMADSGLGCTVHASDRLNLMEVERHALQRRICENTLRFAAEVGAGVVVYHAGQRHAVRDVRHSLRYQLALERRALWDMGDIAAELGVTIAVENSYPEPLILTGAMYAYGAWLAELADQIYAVDHPAVGPASMWATLTSRRGTSGTTICGSAKSSHTLYITCMFMTTWAPPTSGPSRSTPSGGRRVWAIYTGRRGWGPRRSRRRWPSRRSPECRPSAWSYRTRRTTRHGRRCARCGTSTTRRASKYSAGRRASRTCPMRTPCPSFGFADHTARREATEAIC